MNQFKELEEKLTRVRQLRRQAGINNDIIYSYMKLLDDIEDSLLDLRDVPVDSWERIGEPWLMVRS